MDSPGHNLPQPAARLQACSVRVRTLRPFSGERRGCSGRASQGDVLVSDRRHCKRTDDLRRIHTSLIQQLAQSGLEVPKKSNFANIFNQ